MKYLIPFAAILTLTACASTPAYGPDQGNGMGFETQRVENDRFRINYTSSNEQAAEDFALLRAAEVTLDSGFDWFRVVRGNLSGENTDTRSRVATSVGVGVVNGGRSSRTYTNVGVGVGDIVGLVKGPRVTSTLEIQTGNGAKQQGYDVYDAQDIVNNIQPATFTP